MQKKNKPDLCNVKKAVIGDLAYVRPKNCLEYTHGVQGFKALMLDGDLTRAWIN